MFFPLVSIQVVLLVKCFAAVRVLADVGFLGRVARATWNNTRQWNLVRRVESRHEVVKLQTYNRIGDQQGNFPNCFHLSKCFRLGSSLPRAAVQSCHEKRQAVQIATSYTKNLVFEHNWIKDFELVCTDWNRLQEMQDKMEDSNLLKLA